MASTTWYPSGLLSPAHSSLSSAATPQPSTPYALVILNQPINKAALEAVLPQASLLVCADAGGDKYLEYYQDSQTTATSSNSNTKPINSDPSPPLTPNQRNTKLITSQREPRLPDAIIGDLDSITPQGKHYWETKGVEIAHDPDQYSTDFCKSLKWLRQKWSAKPGNSTDSPLDVLMLGSLGGRVDQGFSQIHHLVLARSDPSLLNGRLYLLSEQSLSFVLDQGENVILIDDWPTPGDDVAGREGRLPAELDSGIVGSGVRGSDGHLRCSFQESVGIIPLTGPSVISLEGFEWDVTDWKTEFGGQVSTSNHIRSKRLMVNVQGTNICLFTMELAQHLQKQYQ